MSGGGVLVVDDNTGMRESLVELLLPFWKVRAAPDAETALRLAKQDPPDVVLADLVLPGTGGLDLLRSLRANPGTAEVAVVLLSGHGGSDTVVEGLDAGADDFLTKPFAGAELIARVRTHMKVVRARAELSDRAALLQAQLQSAPQAVLAVGPDRRVLACNHRFEELWRLPIGSVLVGDKSPALLESSLSLVVDAAAFESAVRWGHQHPSEVQHLDVPLRDGRVIEGVSSPILTEQGAYRGRIWFLSDDTERRAAETLRNELLERLQSAQRSQVFLLSAARVLAQSTGYVETLEDLAAVALPTLGDVCFIDVVDDVEGLRKGLRRVASRHVDPARQPLVDQIGRLYPPDPEGRHPAAEVLRTGLSTLSETVSDERLRSACRTIEHFRLSKELGVTSSMSVPLSHEGEVLGAMTFLSAGSGRCFGSEDVSLAEALADQVAAVAGKARRYEQEHLAAHTLQSSLLPSALPRIPGLAVAVRYLPGSRGAEVGGDWYDVVPHPSGAVVLAVGDVAGHDIGAAASMGAVRAGVRALMRHAEDPAALLELLHFSWEDLGVDRMATLVVVFMDAVTGSYTVASAGHPPPLVVPESGPPGYVPVVPTTPLGGPFTPVQMHTGRLAPGDLILLYSDGLIEARGSSLTQGMNRLALSAARAGRQPESFCSDVLARLDPLRSDDIALLAASRLVEG